MASPRIGDRARPCTRGTGRVPASFERIGYDAVSLSGGDGFECPPLSCDRLAERSPTNRHRSTDDADSAFRIAAEYEAGGCEPGP